MSCTFPFVGGGRDATATNEKSKEESKKLKKKILDDKLKKKLKSGHKKSLALDKEAMLSKKD